MYVFAKYTNRDYLLDQLLLSSDSFSGFVACGYRSVSCRNGLEIFGEGIRFAVKHLYLPR
jgi:hypothetical protein